MIEGWDWKSYRQILHSCSLLDLKQCNYVQLTYDVEWSKFERPWLQRKEFMLSQETVSYSPSR